MNEQPLQLTKNSNNLYTQHFSQNAGSANIFNIFRTSHLPQQTHTSTQNLRPDVPLHVNNNLDLHRTTDNTPGISSLDPQINTPDQFSNTHIANTYFFPTAAGRMEGLQNGSIDRDPRNIHLARERTPVMSATLSSASEGHMEWVASQRLCGTSKNETTTRLGTRLIKAGASRRARKQCSGILNPHIWKRENLCITSRHHKGRWVVVQVPISFFFYAGLGPGGADCSTG